MAITVINDDPSAVVTNLVEQFNALVTGLSTSAVSGKVSSVETLTLIT